MLAWWLFVMRSFGRGWDWLTSVGSHVGAAALLLGGLASVILGQTTANWWVTAAYMVAVVFACFSVGAFREWGAAQKVMAGAMAYTLDGWIKQLEGERGRATKWLNLLRDQKADPDMIEYIFDVFWMQTLETLIRLRGASSWAKFTDTTNDPLPPAGQNARERVFDKVTLTIKKLDVAIEDIRAAQSLYFDVFPDLELDSPLAPLKPWRGR